MGDTRLSGHGYAILSREQPKLHRLSDKTVLGSTGCWCDILTFCKVAEMRMKSYRYNHNKSMSTPAVAQMMSTMLYNKKAKSTNSKIPPPAEPHVSTEFMCLMRAVF